MASARLCGGVWGLLVWGMSLISRSGFAASERFGGEWQELKVRVPARLYGELVLIARRDGVSLSSVVRRGLAALVERRERAFRDPTAWAERSKLRVLPIRGGVNEGFRSRQFRQRRWEGRKEEGRMSVSREPVRRLATLQGAQRPVVQFSEDGSLVLGSHGLFLDIEGLEE